MSYTHTPYFTANRMVKLKIKNVLLNPPPSSCQMRLRRLERRVSAQCCSAVVSPQSYFVKARGINNLVWPNAVCCEHAAAATAVVKLKLRRMWTHSMEFVSFSSEVIIKCIYAPIVPTTFVIRPGTLTDTRYYYFKSTNYQKRL